MGGNFGGPEPSKDELTFYSMYSISVLFSYDFFCVIKNKRHFLKCDSVLISPLYIVFILEKVTSQSYT